MTEAQEVFEGRICIVGVICGIAAIVSAVMSATTRYTAMFGTAAAGALACALCAHILVARHRVFAAKPRFAPVMVTLGLLLNLAGLVASLICAIAALPSVIRPSREPALSEGTFVPGFSLVLCGVAFLLLAYFVERIRLRSEASSAADRRAPLIPSP
jgi:hypothetical protein